jgi:hypothetical protein
VTRLKTIVPGCNSVASAGRGRETLPSSLIATPLEQKARAHATGDDVAPCRMQCPLFVLVLRTAPSVSCLHFLRPQSLKSLTAGYRF